MEQLKHLRAERGWSQARLAVEAGLDPATVNQIETGARKPRAASLERLAEALEVSMAELFEGYELPPKAQACDGNCRWYWAYLSCLRAAAEDGEGFIGGTDAESDRRRRE